MKILISGGAGFVGSHAADALRHAGHCVLIVDNFSTGKMENLKEFLGTGGKCNHIDICESDVGSHQAVTQIFQDFKPEAVIHLAAQAAISTSWDNPAHDLDVNGNGTLNMLCAARKFGAKHFVFSSTSAVYRESKFFKTKEDAPLEPNTPYGVSKLAAEMYVRCFFPRPVILRFGNVYGERQVPIGDNQVISRMIRHFKYGDHFVIHGSGNQKRDFVHVSDVAQAIKHSLYDDSAGTYNIASGQSVSVNEIAALVEKRYGVPGYKWEHDDLEDPRKHVCLEVGAAQKGLGWKAKVSIVEGINRTVDWWERSGVA